MLSVVSALAIIHHKKSESIEWAQNRFGTLLASSIKIILVTLFVLVSLINLKAYVANNKWNALNLDVESIHLQPRNEALHQILPQLKDMENDGKFWLDLGLYATEECGNAKMSIEFFERSQRNFVNAASLQKFATLYESENQFQKAIIQAQYLSNYLPNKFFPKIQLLRLYMRCGRELAALSLAKEILQMPVKVPSSEVNEIKEEARNILKSK